jgi:hypothetical protein
VKIVQIICALLLFIAVFELPIGYYTLLRIAVLIGSLIVIITEVENGINFWVITFGIVAIVYNPFIPVYLNNKSAWIPIDIICAILFVGKSLFTKSKS